MVAKKKSRQNLIRALLSRPENTIATEFINTAVYHGKEIHGKIVAAHGWQIWVSARVRRFFVAIPKENE